MTDLPVEECKAMERVVSHKRYKSARYREVRVWLAAREYSKQREEKLREALDNLAEAIGRVEYRGQAGDVEDVDSARHDAVAALAENGDSDAERACENCGNGGTRFLWGGGASCEGCFEEFQQWLRLGDRRPGA